MSAAKDIEEAAEHLAKALGPLHLMIVKRKLSKAMVTECLQHTAKAMTLLDRVLVGAS